MEMTTDAQLRGPVWAETLDKLRGNIFDTYWDIYALSISIGMMYDRQIESNDMVPEGYESEPRSVPRTVLQSAQNRALLEFMFQTAMVTTKHLPLDEDTRLKLAFDKDAKPDFSPIGFLTKFANYGITKIKDVIEETEGVETLEALMTFLNDTYEAGVTAASSFDEIEDIE